MNDLGFIKDPWAWPSMLCPLTRRRADGYGNDCAYLFCNEPVIRHGNIWDPKDTDREERFASHEAILTAGWKVD